MSASYFRFVHVISIMLLVLQFPRLNCMENESPSSTREEKLLARNPIYDFSTNLYLSVSKLKNVDENVLISPFSIRAVSALIYLASRGQTAEEIRNALLFPTEHDELVEGLAKQMASTQIPTQSKFDVGNGIFVREGVYLNRTYVGIARNRLLSEIRMTPFQDPQSSAKLINNWVSEITRNKIRELVQPSTLSPATSVFIANALYFSGQWEKPFDESETAQNNFTLSSGKNVTVPMMQIETSYSYNYIKELGASAISLPFKDSRFEFIILKPDENVAQVERNLGNYPLNLLSSEVKKQSRSVFMKMPRFRLNAHQGLVDVFKQMGVRTLFDGDNADISGLTKKGNKHVVSQIVHQTVLDINEKGATASAASSVSIYPISSPSYFVLDRPFLFLLNDRLTGPVFIGRLENPIPAKQKPTT